MINKNDISDPIDNLEYEKVLEEEIINSYESNFQKDPEEDSKKIKFYMLTEAIRTDHDFENTLRLSYL